MITQKLFKLAKAVLSLEEKETDKGMLISEGELEVGAEVFMEDENGEIQPAPDGEYDDGEEVFVVADGKIVEIKDVPDAQDELDEDAELRIAELEQLLAERDAHIAECEQALAEKDAHIAELEAQLDELNAKLKESDALPADEEVKMSKVVKSNSIQFNLYKK